MKNIKDCFVSVVLLAEDIAEEDVINSISNILDQSHDELEVIVTAKGDIEKTKERFSNDWRVKFSSLEVTDGVNYISKIVEECSGEFIFYKTVKNVLWYPNNIRAHLSAYKKNPKAKWSLSHIEYRDVSNPDHPLNTIGFRINNPPEIEKVVLDEICHSKEISPTWKYCIIEEEGNAAFVPGLVLKEFHEYELAGTMTEEITVVTWVSFEGGKSGTTFEDVAKTLGVPKQTEVKEENKLVDGDIVVQRVVPTVMGNSYLDEVYNNSIREVVKNTEDVTSVAIKRTVGMGDVILTEPIVRLIRNKYKDARITFYTSKKDVVDYFESRPDDVIEIEEKNITEDVLSESDAQIKFDLDLSYESRPGKTFVDSYLEVLGFNVTKEEDMIPRLILSEDPLIDEPYVVVVPDGSGWVGKTWSQEKWTEVIKWLISKGYTVIEPGFEWHSGLTDQKWHRCDLKTLVNLLQYTNLYVGGDNGPMHIARGFNTPCAIIAGAALPYFSNPNRDGVFYIQNNSLECLGCKHRQFFNVVNGQQLTFMPGCENESQGLCMTSITPEAVIACIEKVFSNPKSLIDDVEIMRFAFNIPGWAYYRDSFNTYIQRERLDEHPDQDKNISEEYSSRWKQVYDDHALPLAKLIKERKSGSLLDIGCNMGIFVKAALDEGFDAYGNDINQPSLDKAYEVFPDLTERIGSDVKNSENGYDVITANQVLEHMSDPIDALRNWSSMLKDKESILVIGMPCIDEPDYNMKRHKWGSLGTGEHTWIPSQKAFEYTCNAAGLNVVEYLEPKEKGILAICQKI